MRSLFEAPGKLVLLGEYAVLDGAPALSLAVAHGVACEVTAGPMQVTTPMGDSRFVDAALAAGGAAPARYTFSEVAPFAIEGKPGMGGSAAAVVAALRACGVEDVALAMQVHHAVQGSGSGIDVATAALGSVRFQEGQAVPQTLPMPVVAWSGCSAKTGPRVHRYRGWRDREQFVAASTELADAFAEEPVEVVRRAWRLLCGMSEQAEVAYRTPEIDRLVRIAEEAGGAAKPSGAGGGDVVIGFGPVRTAWIEAGFEVLEVSEWHG